MFNGIYYKDKHSYKDYGLTIKEKNISFPTKNKVKETVPYMNGSYDFSNLYGEQTYQERTLKYTFNLIARNKEELNIKKIKVVDWLLNSYKTQLKDDQMKGYYFLAECEDIDLKESSRFAEITATFVAYPFKISEYEEGNDLWDKFNFELDCMQETKFDVFGSKKVEIINLGSRKITPTVICSSNFDVIKDGITYKFNSSITKDWRFNLGKGINNVILNGTGDIEFIFRKEVL